MLFSGNKDIKEKTIIEHVTKFSGVLKKEDPNNEGSEIKISWMEEPAGKSVTKSSNNPNEEIEMAVLTQDPNPEYDQDEGDSDPEIRKLEGKIF